MHLIRSHGLVHLHVPWMVSDLIFTCGGLFFILSVPVFAFCNLSSMGGSLASDQQHLSMVNIIDVFQFLSFSRKMLLALVFLMCGSKLLFVLYRFSVLFRGHSFFTFFRASVINKSQSIRRHFYSAYMFMYLQYSCNLCSGFKATCILLFTSELCFLCETSIKHQLGSQIHNTIPV